jgi:hypothetical protein
VQEEMKESQRATSHLKVNYEKKLMKQDEEHEYEVIDNKERHKNLKQDLEQQWKILEAKQKKRSDKKELLESERNTAEQQYLVAQQKRKDMMAVLEDKSK